MLTRIRDEVDRAIFERQFNQINMVIEKQLSLPKEARVSSNVLEKLLLYKNFLKKEMEQYDKFESDF